MNRVIMPVLLAALFLLVIVASGCNFSCDWLDDDRESNGSDPGSDYQEPDQQPAPEPEYSNATLAAVGGMYPHRPVLNQARLDDGGYDFSPSFEFITPYFQAVDIAMVALETMQAGPDISAWGVSGYTGHAVDGIWTFNAPIQLSEALKEAGMNMYIAANNHSLDRGLKGLKATLENVRSLGFITTGAYLSPEERDAPDVVDINGIEVAFVTYTYGTNGLPLPPGHEYAVNISPFFEDIDPIIADIDSARAAGADLVAVVPHWGAEYVDTPSDHQRNVARQLAEAGADLILGQHSKLVQPLEWIYVENEDGTKRPTMVVYSLGNFYTNQHYLPPAIPTDLVEYGMLLNIELTKDMDSKETWISAVD